MAHLFLTNNFLGGGIGWTGGVRSPDLSMLFSTHLKAMLLVRQLVRRLLSLIVLSLYSIILKVTPDLAVSISMHIIPSDYHTSAYSNGYFNHNKI